MVFFHSYKPEQFIAPAWQRVEKTFFGTLADCYLCDLLLIIFCYTKSDRGASSLPMRSVEVLVHELGLFYSIVINNNIQIVISVS